MMGVAYAESLGKDKLATLVNKQHYTLKVFIICFGIVAM